MATSRRSWPQNLSARPKKTRCSRTTTLALTAIIREQRHLKLLATPPSSSTLPHSLKQRTPLPPSRCSNAFYGRPSLPAASVLRTKRNFFSLSPARILPVSHHVSVSLRDVALFGHLCPSRKHLNIPHLVFPHILRSPPNLIYTGILCLTQPRRFRTRGFMFWNSLPTGGTPQGMERRQRQME